jgi:hypothetical protein
MVFVRFVVDFQVECKAGAYSFSAIAAAVFDLWRCQMATTGRVSSRSRIAVLIVLPKSQKKLASSAL